jgi:hypothetical protein
VRTSRISARFSESEKRLLASLAARLRRTQSDTLRFLIYEKAQDLELVTAPAPSPGLPLTTGAENKGCAGGTDDGGN